MISLTALCFGLGVFCLYWSTWPRQESRKGSRADFTERLRDDVALCDIPGLTFGRLIAVACGVGAFVFLIGMAALGVAPVALAFALISAWGPIALIRSRARRRRSQRRDLWPDVVDHVASAVRAGLALPEALSQLAIRGPVELRPLFEQFAHDYRTSGDFHRSLDALKARLADPVGDRLVESVRIAREVGGTDLGRLLRTLSTFLREDARTRAELEARQSWTVNAARLALVAPWAVLLMLATRGDSLTAYQRPSGVLVLIIGGAISLLAYQIMRRIGRLPHEERVMR
ncbi:type II secretion system protein F [Calidifontibacter sp. DB0510]|uniref:Type II secretion system protein F n=1 Tax=Metallococcus carri TaxID=1656884 RepID=A0A967B1U9_9MICO|nr:type II secretion system F family protein [Metallococcus carri]NHN56454.1 type II secretion system protein F [Metallococcus carri]NOP36078.1 type II secretion system protein F [Calidifontibacter sp. DB2511S]